MDCCVNTKKGYKNLSETNREVYVLQKYKRHLFYLTVKSERTSYQLTLHTHT